MTSWLLLAEAGASTAGTPSGGLFDLDATLPLMAVQVVLLTYATTEANIREALEAAVGDGYIAEKPQVIRIERE